MRDFPEGFVWGAGSAAYQIEGSPEAEGKGPSIWDEFVQRPGAVKDGDTGELACDSYRRPEADVAAAAFLGLGAYRFSISWPRVQPEGRGRVNEAGLDYYDRLVDLLLARGIRPMPTLYHWDLPAALQRDIGGFRSREIIGRFGDYAELLARRLGDRVSTWFSVNEPFEHAAFGHLFGTHAPGLRSPGAYFAVIHHLLLCHVEARSRIKALHPAAQVGPVLSWTPVHPLREAPPRIAAADRAAAARAEAFMNRLTFDPFCLGRYPEALARAWPFRPPLRAGDLEAIRGSADFIGVNYYSRERAKAAFWLPLVGAEVTGKEDRDLPESAEVTAMGWEVYPAGLGEVLRAIRKDYGNPPTFVTENGAAYSDPPGAPPVPDDPLRLRYLRLHLEELRAAREAGSDLRGYFVWSLTDNFEWAYGRSRTFGLFRVDHESLERRPRRSAYWYREVLRSGSLAEADAADASGAWRQGPDWRLPASSPAARDKLDERGEA